MKKKIGGSVLIIIAIAAVLIVSGCFYSVRENQYGVVMQFGRIVRIDNTSGLHFKMPFVQSVNYVPKALQLYDINPSDVITSDKKSMIADDYIIWQVTDPRKFAQTLNCSQQQAESRAGVSVYNATKNIISSMTQDEVIAARGEKLTSMITDEANNNLGSYGIIIVRAEIKSLDLPDDNKQAVYDRMISERNNIAASYKAEGESEAQKIRNDTDRQVTVKTAEAKKQAAILEAEGESAYMNKLAEAYATEEKADFYNYIRSLDAMKGSLTGGNKTLILDKDSEIAQILYGVTE